MNLQLGIQDLVSLNIPDLGLPKGQLLFVAEVQGHILSIVH